ncbi:FK506-binding protein 5 [Heracleum sosnowskyi]|uniref:FK506-binding protein 5 n=1 Tax=Heracleum sosnowskyi TaxID=360622 RepID=A0AAD8N8I7_9APIA|nr:FK506-binding protein 5 [Heracleum sosnowskyi]
MNSFNYSPNFDNLLLQTLMGRVQTRPTNPLHPPLLPNQTLEDLLLDSLNLDTSDEEDCNENKTQLAKEESKLEKEIVKIILSKKTENLKPNSGQAVTIGENYVCVGFHEEPESAYRVWEWHGHIMLFDEENGSIPEYIYGNYFERVSGKVNVDVKKEQGDGEVGNVGGLKELIDQGDSSSSRIIHRNVVAGSLRF